MRFEEVMKPVLRLQNGPIHGPTWLCFLPEYRKGQRHYRWPAGVGRNPAESYADWQKGMRDWLPHGLCKVDGCWLSVQCNTCFGHNGPSDYTCRHCGADCTQFSIRWRGGSSFVGDWDCGDKKAAYDLALKWVSRRGKEAPRPRTATL